MTLTEILGESITTMIKIFFIKFRHGSAKTHRTGLAELVQPSAHAQRSAASDEQLGEVTFSSLPREALRLGI